MLRAPLQLWSQLPRAPARWCCKKSRLHSLRCGSCDCHVPSCLTLVPRSAIPRGWRVWEEQLSTLCPDDLYDCGCREDHLGQPCPAGFPGDSFTQGADWPQRDGFAHSQPNLLSESRVLSFSASWPQLWGRFWLSKCGLEAWMVTPGAKSSELYLGSVTWAGSPPWAWGEIKLSFW